MKKYAAEGSSLIACFIAARKNFGVTEAIARNLKVEGNVHTYLMMDGSELECTIKARPGSRSRKGSRATVRRVA